MPLSHRTGKFVTKWCFMSERDSGLLLLLLRLTVVMLMALVTCSPNLRISLQTFGKHTRSHHQCNFFIGWPAYEGSVTFIPNFFPFLGDAILVKCNVALYSKKTLKIIFNSFSMCIWGPFWEVAFRYRDWHNDVPGVRIWASHQHHR